MKYHHVNFGEQQKHCTVQGFVQVKWWISDVQCVSAHHMGVFVSLWFSPLPGVGSALASVWFSCSACSLPPLPPKHKHTHTQATWRHVPSVKILSVHWVICTRGEKALKITTKMFHNERTLWTRWVWSLIRCRRERDVHTLCPVASVGGKWHFYQPVYLSRSENTLQFSRIYFAEGLKELTSSTTTSQNIMSGCFPNTQLSFNVCFQRRFWCQQWVSVNSVWKSFHYGKQRKMSAWTFASVLDRYAFWGKPLLMCE